MIIELKVNQPELATRAVDEVRAAGAVGRVSFGSFGWRVLNTVRALRAAHFDRRVARRSGLALYRSWIRWPSSRLQAYREFQVPERSGSTTIISPRFIEYAHRAQPARERLDGERQPPTSAAWPTGEWTASSAIARTRRSRSLGRQQLSR